MAVDAWYVIVDPDGRGPIMDIGGKDINGQIGEAKYLITDPAEIEANARLICDAVNAYDALRAENQRLRAALEYAENVLQQLRRGHLETYVQRAMNEIKALKGEKP